jgi:tetratricopeptide (TPR) repeat protein
VVFFNRPMAALAATQDDPALLVDLARKRSVDHFEHDRYEAALATVEEALARLGDRNDAASRATLLLERGATLKALGRLDEAQQSLLTALETFRDISTTPFANAAYWLCQCALERGDLDTAATYCDVSLEATGRSGHRRGHALSLSLSADIARRRGDVEAGLARLAQAYGEAREIGSLPLQRAFLEQWVERLDQAGRADEAAARRAELAILRRA